MITQVQTKQRIEIDRSLKDEITKNLSPEDLSKIKQGFDLYRGVVDLKQFITIMLQCLYNLPSLENYSKEILTFIEMFLLIDLKNLKKIKFENFTNYLIDRQANLTGIQEYQFFQSEALNGLNLQGDAVFPLQNTKNFAILENNMREVSLIESKTFKKQKIISLGGNIINNIVYLPDYDVYCLATNDKHLNFYETGDDSLLKRFQTPDTTHFLLYLQEEKILISGCTNGRIYQWSASKILASVRKNAKHSTQNEREQAKINPQEAYKQFMMNKVVKDQPDLTCFDILKSLEILITGSNDSKVRIYQIRQNGLKIHNQLQGHYKGIKSVTVSVHHKIIVSCSFDFDILVWNAYLDHPIARLEGHQASLVSVYCPKQHQIIISLDAKSIIKIWNSQKYHLIQSIQAYQNMLVNTSIKFCYKQQLNLAIVYTKRLLFYKYSVNYNPKLTDDQDIVIIRYSNKNLQVYICSGRSIKVWCIEKGVEKRKYVNIVQSDISLLQIDERHRRCFIGCINGSIQSFDIFSGLIIQKYSSHKNQITFLKYNPDFNLLLSGGWDRRIKIHNDTNHLQRIQSRENVLRTINNISEKDLNGASFSINQMLIATHCKTPLLKLWDFEKGYLETQYVLPGDVCQAQFIDPYPLIVVSDTKGSIFIFTTKYYIQGPFKLLVQWKNMFSIQKTSQLTYVSCNHNLKSKQTNLILGDEYGYIRIISLTEFIQDKNIQPLTGQLVGNKNVYRIQDYTYKGATQLVTNNHDFSQYKCSNLVPPSTIRQTLQIKAHSERINYIAMINEAEDPMLLSASSDCIVKMWNYQGDLKGIMRQGAKENTSWQYSRSNKWQNRQIELYNQIKSQLHEAQNNYFFKKRMQTIPFTIAQKFEQAKNEDIYKNLKEVDSLLYKRPSKSITRKY